MLVPQKLISDGLCGVSADQQSVSVMVFNFMRAEDVLLILGQHFHKVNDLDNVRAIADSFGCYVPGFTENPELLGLRGVPHKMYWNLYSQLDGCVGIAGTHTWYLLTCFPSTPQVIIYNKRGVENWALIEAAYRKAGHEIRCLGFDETTDMVEFAKQVKAACYYE